MSNTVVLCYSLVVVLDRYSAGFRIDSVGSPVWRISRYHATSVGNTCDCGPEIPAEPCFPLSYAHILWFLMAQSAAVLLMEFSLIQDIMPRGYLMQFGWPTFIDERNPGISSPEIRFILFMIPGCCNDRTHAGGLIPFRKSWTCRILRAVSYYFANAVPRIWTTESCNHRQLSHGPFAFFVWPYQWICISSTQIEAASVSL